MGPFHKTRGPGVEGFSLEFLFHFVLLKLLNSTGTLMFFAGDGYLSWRSAMSCQHTRTLHPVPARTEGCEEMPAPGNALVGLAALLDLWSRRLL